MPATLVVAVVCALGLAFNIWFAFLNPTGWGVDFNQFYSASQLAGTGHLYDFEALRVIEAKHGFQVPTGRLPVEIYGFKILGSLSYPRAQFIWLFAGIAALIAFAALWPGTRWLTMVAALAWSLPVAMALLFGQDIPFFLMFFAAGLLLMAHRRPWLAGVVFALCICKFHLALGIPIMLAAQRRWSTLISGAVAGLALIASCFLIEGTQWPLQYLKLSQTFGFSPAPGRMPTLFGLASWLPLPAATETLFAVALAALLWVVCRGTIDLGMAGAAAAACGLLLGHHAYASDCALLIPLLVLTLQRQGRLWLNLWAVVLLSPAAVLLLVSMKPFLGQILIAAFVVIAVIVDKWYSGT